MAKFGKKPSRLGVPPKVEEASTTLEAPEHAPVEEGKVSRKKTGRTVPFGTKVTAEFDEAFRTLAFKKKLKHAEMLEEMLELYQKENSS